MAETNGKARIPASVILGIVVILGGGLVTWGETRLTVANNTTQIDDHKDADADSFKKLQQDQKALTEKLNELSKMQGRFEERLDNIRESQRRTESDTSRILNILQGTRP